MFSIELPGNTDRIMNPVIFPNSGLHLPNYKEAPYLRNACNNKMQVSLHLQRAVLANSKLMKYAQNEWARL